MVINRLQFYANSHTSSHTHTKFNIRSLVKVQPIGRFFEDAQHNGNKCTLYHNHAMYKVL